MHISELEEKVKAIAIAEMSLNPHTFKMSTPLLQISNIDSLDFVSLMVAYENEFDVRMEDADYNKIGNLNDLVRVLLTEKGVQVG